MTVRAPVDPEVIAWALDRSGIEPDQLEVSMPKLLPWLHGESSVRPTFIQVQKIAQRTGIPLGYLFLSEPPETSLPIPDFRDGHAGPVEDPSPDLMAVLNVSIRRQDWYRDYAESNGLPSSAVVGRARELTPIDAAADMRALIGYEVEQRAATATENRRLLLTAFEDLGGLTVATSLVGNNTSRSLDPEEFRGFTLADPLAPLIFINTNQTFNAQLFTIAHELGHVWRGETGVSREDPRGDEQSVAERWCNETAAEFLVPQKELVTAQREVAAESITEQLEVLSKTFRCGTLVVLQAIRRHQLVPFEDFDATYRAEFERLVEMTRAKEVRPSGGDYWASQRYRIGPRLAKAVIRDTAAGHTGAAEAVHLTGLGSLGKFQELVKRVGSA